MSKFKIFVILLTGNVFELAFGKAKMKLRLDRKSIYLIDDFQENV